MITPGVIFQADFPPRQELVAGVVQSPPPCGLALLVGLLLAGLGIVELADICQQLLTATLLFLLLLLLLALQRYPPLSAPVRPNMGQIISGQEGLAVLPM